VGLLDQILGLLLVHSRQRDAQRDIQPEAAFRTRPDTDIRGDRGIVGDLDFLLRSSGLQSADEAGGVAGREKLFGIVACPTGPAEFLRCGELDLERAVRGGCAAVTATGCRGFGGVFHINWHVVSSHNCREYSFNGIPW